MTVLLHINGQLIGGIFLTAALLYLAGFFTACFLLLSGSNEKKEKQKETICSEAHAR